jgi:hypothetical protein
MTVWEQMTRSQSWRCYRLEKRSRAMICFSGTTGDAYDARIDKGAGDREFGHVAVAAEELQAVVDHFVVQIGDGEFYFRGIDGAEFAAQVLLDAPVGEDAKG